MSRFSPQFLDELRGRTLLSALVGRSVKLTRAGREWKACCPFHHEKSPSFYVNDDKGFYHCFGCSAHGDAIRWMTDQQGLSFLDAVKELADNAGLALPAPDPRAAERDEAASKQHDVMAAAAEWFAGQLREDAGAAARAYLAKRGITPATVEMFGMGFAPDRRDALKTALARFGDPALIEAGLLISVEEKTPYDRFRGRLMIPIRDPRGRVIAFGGRILGAGEPKYLNSPDTPLFDKGRTLYNLDRAAPVARKAGRLIVVEGYMDVIALAQAGIGEVVAPLGTALTEAQLERLWRVVDVPVLCLDGDSAGKKAAVRAAERALPLLEPGKSLEVVSLPQGKDPDDVIQRSGIATLSEFLNKPESLVSFVFRTHVENGQQATPEGRAKIKAGLDGLAAVIGDRSVSLEYRSTFRDLFFETFGFGKRKAERIAEAMALARRSRGTRLPELEDAFERAVLLGLMRYGDVLQEETETVCQLHFENIYHRQWRDCLVEAAVSGSPLDEDIINTILENELMPAPQQRSYVKDLAFSFFHQGHDRARGELKQVISFMIEDAETRDALDRAQARWKETFSDGDWEDAQSLYATMKDVDRKRSEWAERFQDAA